MECGSFWMFFRMLAHYALFSHGVIAIALCAVASTNGFTSTLCAAGRGGMFPFAAPVRSDHRTLLLPQSALLSSLCWKQQSAKFNIQTSRSLLVPPTLYPFYFGGKKSCIMWFFYWIWRSIDLDLPQSKSWVSYSLKRLILILINTCKWFWKLLLLVCFCLECHQMVAST